jgi:uncharacterized protein (TIGR02145 family)
VIAYAIQRVERQGVCNTPLRAKPFNKSTIKQLNKSTIMKKLYYFLLLLPLWGSGGLSAQVSVELMGKTPPQVFFTVSWGTKAPYNNKIWVLAQVSTFGIGSEERALVTEVSATGATASTVTGHRGFWLETSGSNGSTTVTATLSLASGVEKFNECVYAFDYPPNAVWQSDGTYQLRGSRPFIINGNITEHSNTFGPGTCITSITDLTDNPTWIVPTPFSAGSITTAGTATVEGIASTAIVADAIPASGGDRNITYQWRRSDGTGSATLTGSSATYALSEDPENYSTAGTYYFTRYAKDGCNTSFTPSDGQYTLRVVPDAALPPYSGTLTWTVGTQIWSGALSHSVTGCNATTDMGSNPPTTGLYRSTGLYSGSGYLYNWKCVNDQGANLCPSPWRVPSVEDFRDLDRGFGGTGLNRTAELSWITDHYINQWGGCWCGYASGTNVDTNGTRADYWSSDPGQNNNECYGLHLNTGGTIRPDSRNSRSEGKQIKCVL